MRRAIVLEEVRGLAFVEDGGRPGHAHAGVPSGGALVRGWMARANLAVGNAPGAACIERFGAITVRARGELCIATEDGVARRLRDGEQARLEWTGAHRAGYLAIDGGLDVPLVWGGRGTLVSIGVGGHEGRALRKGDTLALLPPSPSPSPTPTPTPTPSPTPTPTPTPSPSPSPSPTPSPSPPPPPIRVTLGPDALSVLGPDAAARIASARFAISPRSDRTGTRLELDALPPRPTSGRTTPMIRGAIELPPSGEPIVLGPDHPTTGGYPVIAMLTRVDDDAFHALPTRAPLRLMVISIQEARALCLNR